MLKTEQNMDLDNKLYSFLDSQINTHFEHLEIVFKECTSEEIKSAADRLIERGMIYIVKYIHDKPLYATTTKRHLQTPYP